MDSDNIPDRVASVPVQMMWQVVLATVLFMDGSMKEFDEFRVNYPIPLSQCLIIPLQVSDGGAVQTRIKYVCETTDKEMVVFTNQRGEYNT